MDTNQIIEKLNALDELTAMPNIAMDLMAMLNDPSSLVKDIVQKIKLDEALTIFVLKSCNSALYGIRKEINSLRNAINLLGYSQLKNLLMSYFMRNLYNLSGKDETKDKMWEHTIAVAITAQELSKRFNTIADTAYLAGLVHDIGKLAIYHIQADKVTEVNLYLEKNPQENILEIEKKIIGITHVEAGEIIVKKWQLSPYIIEAIKNHHNLEKASTEAVNYVKLIHYSDILVNRFLENREIAFSHILEVKELKTLDAFGFMEKTKEIIEDFIK